MKADARAIERAIAQRPTDLRLVLLYGPEEATSRDYAQRFARAIGPDGERVDLDGATLARDPARLGDEAAALALFGGPRLIAVRAAGDEAAPAVANLLAAERTGDLVVMTSGALRATADTVKLALASPHALALASYPLDEAAAARIVVDVARDGGLRVDPDLARRIVDQVGTDRLRIASEIDKFATALDAAPDRPRDLDDATVDALGADVAGEPAALVTGIFGGVVTATADALQLSAGEDRTQLLRAVQRRALLLLDLRGKVDAGSSVERAVEAAGKAIHFRDKPVIVAAARRWTAAMLDHALDQLFDAERAMRATGVPGALILDAAIMRITRAAARRA